MVFPADEGIQPPPSTHSKKPRSSRPELDKIKESFSNLRKQSNEIVRNNVEYRRKNAVLEQETQNLKDENILLSSRNVQLVAELEKWRAKPTRLGDIEENKIILTVVNTLLLSMPALSVLRDQLVSSTAPDRHNFPSIPPSHHIHNFSALPPPKISMTPGGLDPTDVLEVEEEDNSRYNSPILAISSSPSDRSLASSSSTSSLGQSEVDCHPYLSSRSHSRNSRASRRSSGLLSLETDDYAQRRRKSPTPESEDGREEEMGVIPDERCSGAGDLTEVEIRVEEVMEEEEGHVVIAAGQGKMRAAVEGEEDVPARVDVASGPVPPPSAALALKTPLHQPTSLGMPSTRVSSASSSPKLVIGAPRKPSSSALYPEPSPTVAGPSSRTLASSTRPLTTPSVSRKPVPPPSMPSRPNSAASNASSSSSSSTVKSTRLPPTTASKPSSNPLTKLGSNTTKPASNPVPSRATASTAAKGGAAVLKTSGSMVKMKDLAEAMRKGPAPEQKNAEASSSKIQLSSIQAVPSPPPTSGADLVDSTFVTTTTNTSEGSEDHEGGGRRGRRASKSVNYKEPSLTAKMRKPASTTTTPLFPNPRPHSPRPDQDASFTSTTTPSYASRIVIPPPPLSSAATRRKSVLPKKKSLQDLQQQPKKTEVPSESESDDFSGLDDDDEGVEGNSFMDEQEEEDVVVPPRTARGGKKRVDLDESSTDDEEEKESTTPNAKPTVVAATNKSRASTSSRPSAAAAAAKKPSTTTTQRRPSSSRSLQNLASAAEDDDSEDDDDDLNSSATPKAFRIITPAPRASVGGAGGAKKRESGMVPLGVTTGGNNSTTVVAMGGVEAGKKGAGAVVTQEEGAGRRASRRVTMGTA